MHDHDRDPVILSIIDTIQDFLYAARRHVDRNEFDIHEDTEYDVAERKCELALQRLDRTRATLPLDLFWYEGEPVDDLGQLILEQGLDKVLPLACARDLGVMFLAGTCETVDEHGDPDETAYRLFDTEAEARAIWAHSYRMAMKKRDEDDD